MYLPRGLARFNRHVTNPVQRMWAGVLPGFAIVLHTGRRSGRAYRTPVNAFPTEGGFAILLTYGAGTDWLRNLQAGGGELVHRRKRYQLAAPRVVDGPTGRALLPRAVRLVSRVLRNDTVLFVSAVPL